MVVFVGSDDMVVMDGDNDGDGSNSDGGDGNKHGADGGGVGGDARDPGIGEN
jgi:hypothetical protein